MIIVDEKETPLDLLERRNKLVSDLDSVEVGRTAFIPAREYSRTELDAAVRLLRQRSPERKFEVWRGEYHQSLSLPIKGTYIKRFPDASLPAPSPRTAASVMEEWWVRCLTDGKFFAVSGEWPTDIRKDLVQSSYGEYVREVSSALRPLSLTALGKFLREQCGGDFPLTYQRVVPIEIEEDGRVRTVRKRLYHYQFPALQMVRLGYSLRNGKAPWELVNEDSCVINSSPFTPSSP